MTRETKSSYSLSDKTVKISLLAVLSILIVLACETSWRVANIGKTPDIRYKSEIVLIDPLAKSWLPQVQNSESIGQFFKNNPTGFMDSADYADKGKVSQSEAIEKLLEEKLITRETKSAISVSIVHLDPAFPIKIIIPILKLARDRYFEVLISTYHSNMELSAKANQDFDFSKISDIEANYILYKDKFYKEPMTSVITAAPRFDFYKYGLLLISILAAFLYFTPYSYLKNSFNFTRSLLFGDQTVEQN